LTALVHGLGVLKYRCMKLEYRFKTEIRRTTAGRIGDMEWVSWTRAMHGNCISMVSMNDTWKPIETFDSRVHRITFPCLTCMPRMTSHSHR
jgi:hypothetical protein